MLLSVQAGVETVMLDVFSRFSAFLLNCAHRKLEV